MEAVAKIQGTGLGAIFLVNPGDSPQRQLSGSPFVNNDEAALWSPSAARPYVLRAQETVGRKISQDIGSDTRALHLSFRRRTSVQRHSPVGSLLVPIPRRRNRGLNYELRVRHPDMLDISACRDRLKSD